jgi:hypothetical protein
MRRLLSVALLLAACAKTAEPSPDYAAARRRYAEIVAVHAQDAAARPETEEVLALLARVPAGSADAPAAAELRARIDAERKALADERAHRAAVVARAEAPPAGASPAAASPAPARPGLELARGAKLAELEEKGGGCFQRTSELEIGTGEQKTVGEAWALKADAQCEERFPAQKGMWLVFAKGAYLGAHHAAEVKVEPRRVERVERFEAVPLPGGGYGRKLPDGTVGPLPPGAKLDAAPLPPPKRTGP